MLRNDRGVDDQKLAMERGERKHSGPSEQ